MKKSVFTLIIITCLAIHSFAQVAINTTGAQPDVESILDISSTDKGLLIPRMTSIQRSVLANKLDNSHEGMIIYGKTVNMLFVWNGSSFEAVESGGVSALEDSDNDTYIDVEVGADPDDIVVATGGIVYWTFKDGRLKISNTGNSVFLGNNAGYSDDLSTNNNTFIGTNSGILNTSGSNNTLLGYSTNYTNQEGSNNTIIGYEAGRGTAWHNKSGNIFIGFQAGYEEYGDNKLYIENSSSSIPLIGGDFSTNEIYFNGIIKITGGSPGADKILTSDADGVASWENNAAASEINGLSDGKTDASNLFLGNYSGISDDGDNKTTGVGISSLYWNSSGTRNTAFGYKSSYRNTTGVANVAIGSEALYFNTVKSNLVAVGDSALYYNGNNSTSSSHSVYNTAVGSKSMLNNTTGHNNTAMGNKSMYSNGTGSHNISIGHESLLRNSSGDYNVALGSFSSSFNTGGNHNVNIGYGSDYNNTGGSNNTIIGYKAGFGSTGTNRSGNIFIGHEAGYNETGSNKLYIDNSNDATPLIGGDFSSDELYFNTTKLGIGTTSPNELLEIASPTNDYGRMVVSDGGGSNRNALLFVSPKASSQEARIEAYDYGAGSGLTLKFNTTGDGDCVFGGNVGIGTTNPLNQLHVMGSSTLASVLISPTGTANNDSELIFAEDDDFTYGMSIKYDGGDNTMYFYGKSNSDTFGPHLSIKRDGDIAIGGTNFATGYKLSVEGKVICEEVKVSLQADWPDYVFSDNYELLPIDGFRKFINENGHLPNIPPADEVETSGLELGEMQRLLLEKVEELSLYILKQDERISELENKLSKTQK